MQLIFLIDCFFLPWFLGGGVVGHVCFVCLLFIFYITLIVIYEHFAQYKNFQAHIIMSLLKSVHVSVSNTYIRRKKTSNQRIWILNQDFNQHPVFTMNRDTMYKGLMWIKFENCITYTYHNKWKKLV